MLSPFQTVTANHLRLAGALVALYAAIKIVQLILNTYRVRRRWKDVPSLPRHPLWGNLVNMGEKLNPGLNRHPDYGFEEAWKLLGRPPAFLTDLAPADISFLVVADPAVAELITQPSSPYKYSVPKSDTMQSLTHLIGKESLIIVEGDEWKNLRKRFNRGFAPAHLYSLQTLIISQTRVFVDRLKAMAESKQAFSLKDFSQDLTTDIITALVIETDFQAQSDADGQGHKGLTGVLTASRILSTLAFKVGVGFNPLMWLNPVRPTKEHFYEYIFNRELTKVIKTQIALERDSRPEAKPEAATAANPTSKSIIRLALSGMMPTPALIRNTVSQVKSFLFAGQDTTATVIQWMCFELSKASWSDHHAAIRQNLVAEHDAVFGPGDQTPFNALHVLGRDDDEGKKDAETILGSKLPYTTAFIKETLRMHPPASSARIAPELSAEQPTPFTLPIRTASGVEKEIVVNGLRLYISQYLLHRNPAVWGPDAHVFRPERWLDDAYVANLPAGAWRPFERGPRNCIGQELALLEAKVVLCAVARGCEWEKVGCSGRAGDNETAGVGLPRGDGSDDPEREVWSIFNVTSVPWDGMKMKVKLKD